MKQRIPRDLDYNEQCFEHRHICNLRWKKLDFSGKEHFRGILNQPPPSADKAAETHWSEVTYLETTAPPPPVADEARRGIQGS